MDVVVKMNERSLPATSVTPHRSLGFRITGLILRMFRPLLKVNLLAYRIEIGNALFPSGKSEGEVVGTDPVRILFIGDIAANSYGVLNHGLGVGSKAARFVAREHNIGCIWTSISSTELTMSRTANELCSMELAVDAVVLLLGSPDVLLGTTRTAWTQSLERIVEAARQSANPDCRVVIAAIPPMHRFRAMPRFVKRILALQVQRLNGASVSVAAASPGVTYSPFPSLATDGMFIEDAFNWRAVHDQWGKQLGATTARALKPGSPVT
jgi:hypothetical protein